MNAVAASKVRGTPALLASGTPSGRSSRTARPAASACRVTRTARPLSMLHACAASIRSAAADACGRRRCSRELRRGAPLHVACVGARAPLQHRAYEHRVGQRARSDVELRQPMDCAWQRRRHAQLRPGHVLDEVDAGAMVLIVRG